MTFRRRFLAKAALAVCLLLPSPAAAQLSNPFLQTMHRFQGGSTDGGRPVAALVQAADGNFYGTTLEGGAANLGTVFRMTPEGVVTVLHAFVGGAADGASPQAGLLVGTDGQFYGTTSAGGAASLGVVFRMTTAGAVTLLHTFGGGTTDGANPYAKVIQATDGSLYGTTLGGGTDNAGVVFRIAPSGVVTIVHAFNGTDGASPYAALLQANDGALYGTAAGGGTAAKGVVYRLTLTGTFSVVHSFVGGSPFEGGGEGFDPRAALIQANDGKLYGTTSGATIGGGTRNGSIYRLGTDGSFETLVFMGFDDAWSPNGLLQGTDGKIYGTSNAGGPNGGYRGTLFFLNNNRAQQFYNFFGAGDGQRPAAGLVQGTDGNLYGTTSGDGGDRGTVFRYVLTQPAMNIDLPTANATVGSTFSIHGWAVDFRSQNGPGVDEVKVWAQSTGGGAPVLLGTATYGGSRTDVGTAFGSQFTNSGFDFAVNNLAQGVYDLLVYARSSLVNVTAPPRSVRVTVGGALTSRPAMSLDTPADGSVNVNQPVAISGWAVDLAEASGTGVDIVHVYAYPNPGSGTPPIFLGSAAYGASRPDVAAAFGERFRTSGFSLNASGLTHGLSYQIVVYARSTISGAFNNVRAATVTLTATDPQMSLDSPAPGAIVSQPFLLKGWALDRASTSGPGVDAIHVWAQPIDGGPALFVGVGHYGEPRGDVGTAYGAIFTNSGFTVSANGLPGNRTYDISVYARSTLTGTFSSVRVVRLSVAGSTTRIALDTPGGGSTVAQGFTMAGWAIDPSVPTGTGVDAVEVWAHPVGGGTAVRLGDAAYGGARPDVGAVFGSRFTNSAFSLAAPPLPAGTYDLIVYARSVSGTSTGLPPVRVVVNP
jgi:uncharacterized repeat protein (TIGR03803 family)